MNIADKANEAARAIPYDRKQHKAYREDQMTVCNVFAAELADEYLIDATKHAASKVFDYA